MPRSPFQIAWAALVSLGTVLALPSFFLELGLSEVGAYTAGGLILLFLLLWLFDVGVPKHDFTFDSSDVTLELNADGSRATYKAKAHGKVMRRGVGRRDITIGADGTIDASSLHAHPGLLGSPEVAVNQTGKTIYHYPVTYDPELPKGSITMEHGWVYLNCFLKNTEYMNLPILYPTKFLGFEIVFAESTANPHPMGAWSMRGPISTSEPAPKPVVIAGKTRLRWEKRNPEVGVTYKIEWAWTRVAPPPSA